MTNVKQRTNQTALIESGDLRKKPSNKKLTEF